MFFLAWLATLVALAFIPAVIASNKGRSFVLWYFFGFLCWLPALIVSLVISNNKMPPAWGPGPTSWSTPPPPPPPGSWSTPPPPPGSPSATPPPPPPPTGPPAGWYPDPGGTASQRYWDGTTWTEHLS